MFKAFAQLFSAITVFFGATEKLAKSADHLASWAEETAAGFNDEARYERQIKAMELKKKLTALEAA